MLDTNLKFTSSQVTYNDHCYLAVHCVQGWPLGTSCAPHLCAMADFFCFFLKMQQAIRVTAMTRTISVAIVAITPTDRPIISALGAGSGVITGTETQRGSK